MIKLMEGKAGLVTGAGSGIGRAGALAFAREGAKVMVSDANVESGNETVKLIKEMGGEAEFFKCDVSNEAEVKALVEATVASFGKLDYAFNNAGVNGIFAPISEIDSSVWDKVIKINLYGVFYCIKHEVIAMLKNGGGAIVNTSSGSGLTAIRHNAPYNSSKFGVIGITQSTAYDYGKYNIRVNALCPGTTNSEMMNRAIKENGGAEYEEQILKTIPMGVIADPEDQANAAVWLCSDEARMVTGVSLPVDGGYILGK